MSRNLCRDRCVYCGDDVRLVPEWPVIQEWARPVRDRYRLVSAICRGCQSLYVAHVDYSEDRHLRSPDLANDFRQVKDLSFWSTFNDEPSEMDKPKREVKVFQVKVVNGVEIQRQEMEDPENIEPWEEQVSLPSRSAQPSSEPAG